MNFKQFCEQIANSECNLINVENISVPEVYSTAVESLIKIMKNKTEILDNINIPFIEASFECDYETLLKEKLEDNEIPDGIIYRLSEGIYNKTPSELSVDEQKIIKVLSIYICIQNLNN